MPHIARMVKAARWEASPEERSSGELPADPLGDLRTSGNALSVYVLDDRVVQVDSVMTAHAATKDRPANIDCLILDAQHLEKLALQQEDTAGTTPNAEVNRLHRNFTGLTARTLVELCELFFRHGEIEGLLKKQIKKQIVDGIRSGAIERGRLNKRISERLNSAI